MQGFAGGVGLAGTWSRGSRKGGCGKKVEEMEVEAGRGDVAGTCAMEIAVAASLPDEELCLGGSCTGQDCVGPKRGVGV